MMYNHRKENLSMHSEDLDRDKQELIDDPYNKGKKDMLKDICDELTKAFKIKVCSDSAQDVVKRISEVFSLKNNSKIIHAVDVDLTDLYKLIKDTEKIVNLNEQGLSNKGKLKLKNFRFDVRVLKSQYVHTMKDELAEAFRGLAEPELDESTILYIEALKKEIVDFKENNFDDFIVLDQNLCQNKDETFDLYMERSLNFNMNTKDIMTLKFQMHNKKMMKENEWKMLEISQLKEKHRNKVKRLDLQKLELLEYERVLNKKNIEIVKDRQEIERLREAYYIEKNRIAKNYEIKSKKLSDTITEITMISFDSLEGFGKISPITETEMVSDFSYISDNDTSFDSTSGQEPDINTLQKRITDLESFYKSEKCPEQQEKIKKELDSLRNHVTCLKSSALLKTCAQNHKKYSSLYKARPSPLNDSLFIGKKPSPIGFQMNSPTGRMSISTVPPICPYPRSARSTMTSPKGSSQTFNFNDILPKEVDEQDFALRKYLRAQEIKLREKEERLEKEKEIWMQKWNKAPMANEFIPMVKKEMLDLKQKSEDFDKYIRENEKRELELKIKEEDAKRKEKEMEIKLKELTDLREKFEEEKTNLIQKLGKLRDGLVDHR
ncbi:hypothetical protein SteCoe_29179 [Stentor coeruleus]|uniref:Uncharacterized protein n=1 Tax=Stentor coeruleus TaxID=5963 RepID=A0A1R2B6J0_9CILI|nr:hypothetical protein SteCoe_29179 [Stentor coeruleus]